MNKSCTYYLRLFTTDKFVIIDISNIFYFFKTLDYAYNLVYCIVISNSQYYISYNEFCRLQDFYYFFNHKYIKECVYNDLH